MFLLEAFCKCVKVKTVSCELHESDFLGDSLPRFSFSWRKNRKMLNLFRKTQDFSTTFCFVFHCPCVFLETGKLVNIFPGFPYFSGCIGTLIKVPVWDQFHVSSSSSMEKFKPDIKPAQTARGANLISTGIVLSHVLQSSHQQMLHYVTKSIRNEG